MTRSLRALSTLALAATALTSLAANSGLPGIPEPISLNGDWRFRLAANEKAADEYRWFFEPGYDVSAWATIPVPSHWNLQGFEEPYYVDGTPSEGFYVTTFTAPPKGEKEIRALLEFGGVWMSAEVWLNGKRVGQHDSGFTSFAFDLREQIKWGEENTLAVRVRQQVQPELFKFDTNDDWALAGIFRDVQIEFTPREFVMSRVAVETDLDELYQDATLTTRIFVERWEEVDFFDVSDPIELRATLKDASGQVVQSHSETVTINGAHQGNDFPVVMRVESPAKWTAETPNLYTLTVELLRDGQVADRWEDRIGFREVSTAGGVLRVNGQPVKLRGVARHDQFPDVGRATRREHWVKDIELMKAGNINAVRTAHYPPAEGFVRLCDEYGLYVVEEIPLGFGGDRMWNPSFATGMLTRIYETIQRDINRPSIIVWSFGNEDPFSALHLTGLQAIKGLDDTRPTLMPFRAEKDLPPEVDILAPHYWSAAQYDELAGNGTRPLLTTEYTHAIGPNDFGEFEDRWNAITRHPSGAGGMIWLWADQGLRRHTEGQKVLDPLDDKASITRKGAEFVADKRVSDDVILDAHGNAGSDGIVDADRVPQRDYWEARAVYAPVQLLDAQVAYDRYKPSVSVAIQNGYDFTDLSAVTIDWQLFRDGKVLDSGKAQLTGKPHTIQRMTLPTTKVDPAKEGAHYYHLTFRDAQGIAFNQESVRLGQGTTVLPTPENVAGGAKIVQDGDTLRFVAGDVEVHFKDGVIEKAKQGGKNLIERSDFIVWRPGTWAERNRLDRIKNGPDWKTFMQGLKPTVVHAASEDTANGVVYRSTVEYRADAENAVTVDYTYTLRDNGQFDIAYAAKPTIKVVDWIPEVGVSLKIADEPLNAAWLGEGVIDSMPGKSAASIFGLWDVALFSQEARGTKMDVEWVKVYDKEGWGLLATGMDAFRFEGINGKGSALRLLSHVAGSWTKNGPAERAEWNLPVADATYSGGVTLTFLPGQPETAAQKTGVVTDSPAVVSSGFINPDAPYKSCHASTIVQASDGTLVASWFGGTKERNPDVTIWVARMVNGQWQPAKEVATGVWTDGKRYPTWNPVLFQPKNGPLQLFYKVGPSPSEWWGMVMTSNDNGKTWSAPRQLPDGILGPIKNKPVQLADGTWLSPSSTEGEGGWKLHFERSEDGGKTWTSTGPIARNDLDSIQPSVLFHADGRLQAINRTRNGNLSVSWSDDQGRTWTPTERTPLPTPGSGTDAVTLQDGRQLLVYNHSSPPEERPGKGVRYPLDIAISKDGVHWERVLTLETTPRSAGYAYPAVIQAKDGLVHITYTWDRDRIKHVVLDPSKL